ncbi:MAG: hypothetical protein OEW02_08915, partial [Myxococcales bacterium]|nr:hypothetical protein [Myxococcales bacterium]
ACPKQAPIVELHTYAKTSGLLERVAIVPFSISPRMPRATDPGAISGAAAADLLARFVAEAIEAEGVRVIPASDVALAFEAAGQVVPRGDAAVAASLAARKFGATAIVLGELLRYREREGGPSGAFRPASVSFVLTLHSAPEALRVWSARFDETQPAVSENVVRAREYPGRGTRWLTAAELARFGVKRAIGAIPPAVR